MGGKLFGELFAAINLQALSSYKYYEVTILRNIPVEETNAARVVKLRGRVAHRNCKAHRVCAEQQQQER